MADLCALSSVLHSLQVKLAVAAQKNNPKVNLEKHDLSLHIALRLTYLSAVNVGISI